MRAQFLLAALQAARVGAVGGADSKCYAHRYKDVCDAFCGTPDRCDLRKVFEHYHGKSVSSGVGAREGRKWGCRPGPPASHCPGARDATAPATFTPMKDVAKLQRMQKIYAQLRTHQPVDAEVIQGLFEYSQLKSLKVTTRRVADKWKRWRPDLTFRNVGSQLPRLRDVDPALAETIARSLLYRQGPYECLTTAEDLLSIPDRAVHHGLHNAMGLGHGDQSLCQPMVIALLWWMQRSPPADDIDALYRFEEPLQDRGWALQFQESALCPNGKKQYDLDACGPTLLRVGNVLTVNTSITYQGDSKNNTLIDARQPKLKIICTQKPCVPQIWSYSPNAPLRWRVLPPLGEPHIIEGNRMHFNTLEIHHALRNPKDDPFPLTIPFNRRKYKFDDTFDIATHVPELDISEIVLRHGARMRIERVDRDDKRMTVTARQLGPP